MADIKQIKTPDGVTHDIRDDSKLPLSGGIMTGILYTQASTPFFIGKNGKVGMRAATADKSNVGQINISNAWYDNGNQYGSQISAYNGAKDAYNELRVSHNGLEYNCDDGNTYKILHENNYKTIVTPTNIGAAASSHTHTIANITNLQTSLDCKADDYSLEIYNGTSGNPKPVRFLTVGYDTCNSENGVAIKIGMVSGHGNGSSYAFLEDAIIRVTFLGGVEVDNFKYYGADAGTYDGAGRQYGDIFWVIDETNKAVTFYCLMGQYARVNSTPYKRLTYSTGGTITQYTTNAVYTEGTKTWANNNLYALKSDIKSGLPTVNADNNGQILKVVNGEWSAALELNTIPSATSTTVGGIKTGYTASGKNYPVILDSDGKAYVNVPWTDTNTDTNTWRPIKVNNSNLLTDSSTALNFSAAGFSTVSGSSGTVTFDTKIRKVASLAEATDTSCVYLIPSSSGNLQQSYIIASSAPSDTTKIWIDSANSNIAKVWNGSAWSTLGAVWS